jgi:putative endonuclease
MADWHLYMIRCRDTSLYTGIATCVERRFAQHQEAMYAGSKYLKGRGPLALVFQRKIGSKSLALKIEIQIKKLSRLEKEKLIQSPERVDILLKQLNGGSEVN